MLEPKDLIKQKLDIAEVVGEYITLKPAGSGSLKGLCPFHQERSPSFHVSRERQMWHCFGCAKGGDMFAFVMEMDGLSFPEAMRHLAKKAGVELPEYKPTKTTNLKERLIAMHDVAGKYYTKFLLDDPAAAAMRAYVARRGIGSELIEKFRLGAAPDRWDGLVTVLKSKGFTEQEVVDGGLALRRKSGTGVFDRFRNRIMIPLCDTSGNILGFTARILPGANEADGPKYLNSPETPIYHKSDMLFGLHLAKNGIRTHKEVIVVEGNLDVIASHKAGVENVVASSGTALTESQLRTLARYTKRITFALDEDNAGFLAAKRVLDLALQLQTTDASLAFDIRCLIIPPGAGKDPDEIVQKDPSLWQSIATHSEDVVEYFFTKQLRDFEASGGSANIELRSRLVDDLLPQVVRLQRADRRHLYLLRMADATHVSVDLLTDMLNAQLKGPQDKSSAKPAPRPVAETKTPEDKTVKAAAFLLGLALRHEAFAREALAIVQEDKLSAQQWTNLYRAVRTVYTQPQTPVDGAPKTTLYLRLRAWLEQHGAGGETSLLDALVLRTDELLAGLTPKAVRAEADRNIAIIQEGLARQTRKALEASIREAELAGDSARLAELMHQYSAFLSGR